MSGVSKPDQAQNNSTDAPATASPILNSKAAQRRDENQYWGLKLTEAIRDNNKENVKGIIKNRLTSINERDKEGQTALHVACATGNIEMVKFLIKKKAAVNIVDKNGDTPLQRASRSAYLEVCEFMLENGADPMYNINTNSATTPLHCLARINSPAKIQKNLQVISVMIEKGADINAQTRNGITPLHACSETGVLEIVDLLLSSGASVNLTDANNEDPLHYTVKAGHSEVARTLMLHGADPLAKGKNGTSVEIAEAAGFTETLSILTNKSIRDIGKSQALATFNKLMQPWVKVNRPGRRIEWIIDFSNKGVQHFPNVKQVMLKHLFNMLSTTYNQLKRRTAPNIDSNLLPRAKSDGQLTQSSSKVAQIFGLDNSEDSEEFIQRACVEGQEALHLTEKATQVLGIAVSDVAVSYHKQPKRGKSTALIMKQETRESTTPMKRRRSSGVIPNKENPEDSEGPRTSPKSESKTSPSSVMIVTPRVKTPSMLLKTSPVSTPAPSKRLTIDESKNRLISELSIRLTTTEESEDTPTGSNSNVTTPHSDRSTNESRSARTDSATDSPIQERSSVKENRRKLRNSVMFNLQLLERELKEIERNKLTDEDLDLLMRKSSAGSARRPKLSTTSLVKSDSGVNNNNNSLENSENTEPKNSVNEVDPHQQKIQIKKAKLSLSDNSVLVQRHLNMPEEYATVVASVDHKEKSPRDHNLDPNTYLKCINMANNIISDISPNAFMFPLLHNALEILDLSNNLLETLPPEINMLKRLQQLCVQRNFLKELPKEIGDLKYLRILYVYNNFLENVPEEITRCKSLKTIHIQNNKLASLPLELASLALEDLQLDGNPCVINDESPVDLATASTKDILTWMEKERKREKKSKSSKNSSVVAKRKSSTRNKPAIVSANTEQKFETLLADPKVNQSFRIFLEKEYASENLLFYNAVEEYKLQIQKTPLEGFEIALGIYNEFVNSETAGTREINLPNEVRENLMTIFEKSKRKLSTVRKSSIAGVVSGSVFDTAQRFVGDLLRFDHFKRFLQSDYFKH